MKDVEHNSTRLEYPFAHRFLHWAIAIVMSFILLTILLRLGWMNKFHIAAILEENLNLYHIELGEAERIALAKKIRKPMWDWHIYSGYALIVLYVLRIVYNSFDGKGFFLPFRKGLLIHERVQSWSYLSLYLLIAGSLVTGMLIVHGPKSWKASLENVHQYSHYYLLAFIAIHFVGLYFNEISEKKGKVNRMITGQD